VFAFTVIAIAESIGVRNTAVINGSTVSFSCVIHASQSEVCWSRETASPNNKKFYNLYVQGSVTSVCEKNKCNVTVADYRYTLTISSVQHYDAGFYECSECIGSVQQAAQLIVLQPADKSEGMYASSSSFSFIIIS